MMASLYALFEFLTALPDLMALYKILKERIEIAETERKVKEDVKTIHQAFTENDISKLNELFNSK